MIKFLEKLGLLSVINIIISLVLSFTTTVICYLQEDSVVGWSALKFVSIALLMSLLTAVGTTVAKEKFESKDYWIALSVTLIVAASFAIGVALCIGSH